MASSQLVAFQIEDTKIVGLTSRLCGKEAQVEENCKQSGSWVKLQW